MASTTQSNSLLRASVYTYQYVPDDSSLATVTGLKPEHYLIEIVYVPQHDAWIVKAYKSKSVYDLGHRSWPDLPHAMQDAQEPVLLDLLTAQSLAISVGTRLYQELKESYDVDEGEGGLTKW